MCSSLSSSFAFFDGDFIRHLPRPLQHHIDEVPRARRLVSVDGNSSSKRRNIIRELGQRNPNTDDPTTTLSWLFRGSWWRVGCDRTLFSFPNLGWNLFQLPRHALLALFTSPPFAFWNVMDFTTHPHWTRCSKWLLTNRIMF